MASAPDNSGPTAYDMTPKKRGGRPRGKWHDKAFRDAVQRASFQRARDGRRNLDLMAEALVRAAIAGDTTALQHVGDRLDGKVSGGPNDNQTRVSFVVHMPAPLNPDQWQRMASPMIEHAPQATQLTAQRDEKYRVTRTSPAYEDATEANTGQGAASGEPGHEQGSESAETGEEGNGKGNNITLGTSQPDASTNEARASDDVILGDTDSNVYPLTR